MSLANRARDELRSYAIVALYLFVCFAAILAYKEALLRETGVAFAPFGVAAAKALILGKFILIGEAVGVGTRFGRGELFASILRKVLLFFVLLIVLTVLEELLVGWFHGRSAAEVLAELFGDSLAERFAASLLMLLVLVPLITVKEFGRALGPGGIKALLLDQGGRDRHRTSAD